jgi:hypothetical protein
MEAGCVANVPRACLQAIDSRCAQFGRDSAPGKGRLIVSSSVYRLVMSTSWPTAILGNGKPGERPIRALLMIRRGRWIIQSAACTVTTPVIHQRPRGSGARSWRQRVLTVSSCFDSTRHSGSNRAGEQERRGSTAERETSRAQDTCSPAVACSTVRLLKSGAGNPSWPSCSRNWRSTRKPWT